MGWLNSGSLLASDHDPKFEKHWTIQFHYIHILGFMSTLCNATTCLAASTTCTCSVRCSSAIARNSSAVLLNIPLSSNVFVASMHKLLLDRRWLKHNTVPGLCFWTSLNFRRVTTVDSYVNTRHLQPTTAITPVINLWWGLVGQQSRICQAVWGERWGRTATTLSRGHSCTPVTAHMLHPFLTLQGVCVLLWLFSMDYSREVMPHLLIIKACL